MNRVSLNGHFAKVEAHTNGDVSVSEVFEWKHGDGYYSATFVTVDDAWIEVRVATAYFEEFSKKIQGCPFKIQGCPFCHIEGRLATEVGLGSGIVRNYVWIE